MSVLLGIGDASGYFFHAPSGTAIPKVTEAVPSEWKQVGLVTSDGLTLSNDYGADSIRDWSNQIQRVISSDTEQTASCGIMDTNEETFKVMFGADAVTQDRESGTTTVSIPHETPKEEAFLWRIKDGDNVVQVACQRGQVQEMDDITFAPGDAVVWTPTITGLGNGFEIQTK